ncbi:MAG: YhbY family RNA-binding protein [Polyangiaceae bacterium]
MPTRTKPPALSSAALRKLRALGHALSPVVAIGKEGLTDSLIAATDSAIATHELVKVKIQREAPVDRHEAGIELAARTGAVLAQVIGRTLLLYRKHPKRPKIVLPAPGKPGKPAPVTSTVRAERAEPVKISVQRPGYADGDPEENP